LGKLLVVFLQHQKVILEYYNNKYSMELVIPRSSKVVDLGAKIPKIYSGTRFLHLVNGAASGIAALNLQPESSIGIIGVNSAPLMIAMLGTHKTNHACVPVNYKLPNDKIHFCLQDSNVGFVFCDKKFKHLVPDHIPVIEFGEEFDSFIDNKNIVPMDLDPDRLCMVLYTSGSTGNPKKILFSFKDRFASLYTPNNELTIPRNNIKTLSANPFFHNAGIHWFNASLLREGTVFLVPEFNARIFLETIDKYKINSINVVTPMMLMMLNETELLDSLDLSSIQEIVYQAALADPLTLERAAKVFVNLMHTRNPYGLTETGTSLFGRHPDSIPIPYGSAGYPLPSMNVKLVDDVLYVRTKDMYSRLSEGAEEYFNTKDRFTVDANGFYYYIGRADDMLKCGGEKVFPMEIEAVLNQHPAVEHSLAIGLTDDVKGQKPYAFVKLSSPLSEQELIEYAAKNLATYQIPKRIWAIDQFPINAIGKIDKKNLVQLAERYIL
jgi:acyl-CoA synthetase (AMP-forming)/AMP-acid ligase II